MNVHIQCWAQLEYKKRRALIDIIQTLFYVAPMAVLGSKNWEGLYGAN